MLIIRHGEIFTKSEPVRKRFISILYSNIRKALPDAKVILKRWRIFVDVDDEKDSLKILQRIFGIVSISRAVTLKTDIDEICKLAVKLIPKNTKTFGVKTQRITKELPMNSQQISAYIGSYIVDKKKLKVNLTNPDCWIHVEIYGEDSFVFTEVFPGTGGLPVGSAGGFIDCKYKNENDFVSAWMMLKRGAFVPFHKKLQKWMYGNKTDIEPIAVVSGVVDADDFAKVQSTSKLPVFSPLIGFDEKEISDIKKKVLK